MTKSLEAFLLERTNFECPFIDEKLFYEVVYSCMEDKGCLENFTKKFANCLRAKNLEVKDAYMHEMAEKYSVEPSVVRDVYENLYNLSLTYIYSTEAGMLLSDVVPHARILATVELRLEKGDY